MRQPLCVAFTVANLVHRLVCVFLSLFVFLISDALFRPFNRYGRIVTDHTETIDEERRSWWCLAAA